MSELSFKARVPVFDANIRVGDRRDEVSPSRTRADLLREMDRHGVERALIYHAQGEFLSPVDGNRFLEAWLGDDGRLEAQWMMMPTDDSIDQIKSAHRDGKVRSVRLHNTRSAGLPFRPWAYGEMLSWLSEANVPLWIPLPDMDADELVTTLQAFPDLVTVHIGAHYSHHLLLRPLLKTLPNAYLDTSRYESIGGLDSLVETFGARRLVYGSWYSRYVMGPMLFYLHKMPISEQELKQICAENLEMILQGEGRHD